MLGSCFNKHAIQNFNLAFLKNDTDITDLKNVQNQLNEVQPHIIIHTAAYTDVDGCELNHKKALNVNVNATSNIVDYCNKNKTKLIYFSSTGIYGDYKKKAYIETDSPKPTTMHHQSKWLAEKYIKQSLNNFLILRVGWLYGGHLMHKNNFVYKRFKEAQSKNIIHSSSEQIGNPTNCEEVVQQTLLLLQCNKKGIFNCVNSGVNISRFDYVKEIITNSIPKCIVKKADPNSFNRPAPVSSNESAINKKLIENDLNIMSDWKIALKHYIKEKNMC